MICLGLYITVLAMWASCGECGAPPCSPSGFSSECGDPWGSEDVVIAPFEAEGSVATCGDRRREIACRITRVLGSEERAGFRTLLDPAPPDGDLDAALRALLPAIGDRALASTGESDHGHVGRLVAGDLPRVTLDSLSLSPHPLELPIDWEADPHGNSSWLLYFQSLHWLQPYLNGTDLDLTLAAYVVSDYAENALPRKPALEYGWNDHALARRTDRVAAFVQRYVEQREVLDPEVLHSAARILLTHLFALAHCDCYPAGAHNHALMMDLAILRNVRLFPSLIDHDALTATAESRAHGQVEASVTSDGVHIENSPGYQVLYARLLTEILETYERRGAEPPSRLVAARDALLEALAYMVRPDLSLVQFGDTIGLPIADSLSALVAAAQESEWTTVAPSGLEWVATRGSAGIAPSRSDVVFAEGGHAAFRDGWNAADAAGAVAGFFTASRFTNTHYHEDELGFELHGYGFPLVVDTGHFTYDPDDPFSRHQREAHAHSVLIIDDEPYRASGPLLGSGIIEHGAGVDLGWVRAGHPHYQRLGVESLRRTFAHAKPSCFLVIDEVETSRSHTYEQYVQLHPRLSVIEIVGSRTIVARGVEEGAPALTITAAEEVADIILQRGETDGPRPVGWHFPATNQAEPAYTVIFRHHREESLVRLPLLFRIVPPGEGAAVPASFTLNAVHAAVEATWEVEGESRTVRLPQSM